MEVVVKQRQILADIAIQQYGDIRAVIGLARANGISITGDLTGGQLVTCPETIYDRYMQRFVTKNHVCPATGILPTDEIALNLFTEQFTEEFQ